jgi:hypothetical protein
MLILLGTYPEAEEIVQIAYEKAIQEGRDDLIADCLGYKGQIAFKRGNLDQSHIMYEQGLVHT